MPTFDLNILPILRQNEREFAEQPGLRAVTAPRKAARGRERDNLILYLQMSGTAEFSGTELQKLLEAGIELFYQQAGSLTSAMRKTTTALNTALVQRNLSTSGRGLYSMGMLVIAVFRENQCTLSISGPGHVVWVSDGQHRHIFDPALSGKGLGSSQSAQTYLSQIEFQPNDLFALCARFPKDWEADLLNARPPSTLDASYRKLTFTKGDLNAVLIQPQSGEGAIILLRPDINKSHQPPLETAAVPSSPDQPETIPQQAGIVTPEPASQEMEAVDEAVPEQDSDTITEDELDELADLGVHLLQPSAYAIPPKPEIIYPSDDIPEPSTTKSARSFPPSIPRANPEMAEDASDDPDQSDEDEEGIVPIVRESKYAEKRSDKPGAHAEAARQMAKVMAGGIKTGRRANERIGDFLRSFIPKLLPGSEPDQFFVMPTYVMVSMAIIIPVLVAVVSWVIYNKYGLSETYYELYQQALITNGQANAETDPIRQRDSYEKVLSLLDKAEQYRETNETKLLRSEAQAKYDNLMGVIRLEFLPAFTNGLGSSTQISRLAASESDLYMLDAERGSILHATFTGRSLVFDNTFNCQPGRYGGYQVGTLVDILALPKVNAVGATVLGIDTTGNLLYCSPGQVPQVFPLPPLPNTNWGRITSFVLENDRLYILDSASRAVWVYTGKDSTFLDPPYFFFSSQIPAIENAIDLGVSGDDLYLLHADGHISTCTYSRITEVPTRCEDPAPRVDRNPAHQDFDIFAEAHLTQMSITSAPSSVVLLLDADNRSVLRLSPRSLELQNQISGYAGAGSPFQPGPIDAMAISPNYVLYLAINDQVYFATNLP